MTSKNVHVIKSRPLMLDNPDFNKLIEKCSELMNIVGVDDFDPQNLYDYEILIAEEALQALYGDNVYAWFRNQMIRK